MDTWLKICGRVFRFASPRFKMNKVMRRGPSVDLLRGKNSNAACILLLLLSARFTGGGHRTQATLPLHLPPPLFRSLACRGGYMLELSMVLLERFTVTGEGPYYITFSL